VLKAISDLGLSKEEQINAMLFSRKDAICPETGAFLAGSNGRTRSGIRHYVLILPNESVEERGGLFAPYTWEHRSRISAWTLAEAIEISNQRLPKLLKKAEKSLV